MRTIAKHRDKPADREDYMVQRRRTGECEICGLAIADHPQCEACGLLCGIEHVNMSLPFREHKLCDKCRSAWLSIEKLYMGRPMIWEEFIKPKQHERRGE